MKETALQDRLERLAGFGGMNEERAGELLRQLPEMGRIPTEYLLYLAGLKEMETPDRKSLAKPNHHLALRVLLSALPEAARATDSRVGELLRHILGTHPQGKATTMLCLTALLRSYSDRLLAASTRNAYDDEDDDAGFLEAAEDDE